jgi:hypothetical protein
MRFVAPAIGVLLILVGLVWTIQGYGTLKGSFMTNSRTWLWIGIACVVAGVVILIASLVAIRK